MSSDYERRAQRAEYRARHAEAELNAIRQSKAFKLSRKLGVVKKYLRSDPVGFAKKAAKFALSEPGKLTHIIRRSQQRVFTSVNVAEQNAKYQEWILLNEPDEFELNDQREAAQKLKYQPLISIVTPVFNPPLDVLEELIISVLDQTYGNFELCLGNFGDDEQVNKLLKKYVKLDSRIKLHSFAENKGIAGNSNQILEIVQGEYIALLDHDDTLSPDALYENAKLLNDKPYDFIYSDKDKIDEQGNRFDPLFKPELSPEMLLNVNYLTHLNVMRTSIVKSIGGWDSSTDGAQDWDLFLRVVAASKHVGFIPKVLYHWRVIASSTAHSIETKPYALAGQRRAIDKYLEQEGIPATSYHHKTELLLNWNKEALDTRPIVFISCSSITSTYRIAREVRRNVPGAVFVVMRQAKDKNKTLDSKLAEVGKVVVYEQGQFGAAVASYCSKITEAERTVLFLNDLIDLPKTTDWYENLVGWLTIKEVGAVSGRLLNQQEGIVDSGALITPDGNYFPIFQGYPRYFQTYIGNAEWVRNLSVISANFSATNLSLLKKSKSLSDKNQTIEDFFITLSKTKRLVLCPQATATIITDTLPVERHALRVGTTFTDKFSNPNLSVSDPMRLFADEATQPQTDAHIEPIDPYQQDALILANTFNIDNRQLEANKKVMQQASKQGAPSSVAWFLPSFDAVYAGLMNIFSFANYLANDEKLRTTIYILKADKDVSTERSLALQAFPELRNAKFVGITPNDIERVEAHDIGIATLWSTAYVLAKKDNIPRKCYFIQDNEVNFYPKGTISALVELSYQFNFMAIANTDGLLKLYEDTYGGHGVVLKSVVDLTTYYPRKDMFYVPKKPYKVFFYARPNMPRNAFELGIAGLKILKEQMKSDVEIITAGAQWDPAQYGVQGLFTNLGKISYEAVPKLYRSVDAGLMFMFSGHPGVTASELMASGCPVVVNAYDDISWNDLYQNEQTCLVTLPTASEVARNLTRCLTEEELRKKLIVNGKDKAEQFYSGYKKSQAETYRAIKQYKS